VRRGFDRLARVIREELGGDPQRGLFRRRDRLKVLWWDRNGYAVPEAIEAVYPKTIVQTCIVHMIRSSTRFVSFRLVQGSETRHRSPQAGLHGTYARGRRGQG